jgi:hypothetical protein
MLVTLEEQDSHIPIWSESLSEIKGQELFSRSKYSIKKTRSHHTK